MPIDRQRPQLRRTAQLAHGVHRTTGHPSDESEVFFDKRFELDELVSKSIAILNTENRRRTDPGDGHDD